MYLNCLYRKDHKTDEGESFSLTNVLCTLRSMYILILTVAFTVILTACNADSATDEKNMTLQQFGARCDGESDDSQALLAYAEYCAKNGTVFTIPADANVLVPSFITIGNVYNIQVMGTITAPNGIEFRANSAHTLNIWYFKCIKGDLLLSGLKSSDITVQYANELTLYADSDEPGISSIAYNKFWLGHVENLTIQGIGKGWINENFFYGGRIKRLLYADGGEYNHNNNHFYDNTFEDATIEFYCGKNNYIHDARFEGDISVVFHKKASNNYVHKAYVGGHVPGSAVLPSWWNDESNNNYYSYSVLPAVNTYEKTLTAYSYNYNVDQAYPENGKLHIKKGSPGLLETNLISIEHSVGVVIESDDKFFRGEILLYDANGNRIEKQPEYSPVTGNSVKWKENRFVFADTDRSAVRLDLSRNTMSSGIDTGVAFVKIVVNGNSAAVINYLRISVTAPWYVVLDPFSENKLVSSSVPRQGDWEDGTVCYNIGNSEPNAWIYRNKRWNIF